jgi:hypothetical protein
MSSKSSEFTPIRAMLVGAALTGLIAGTSTAASAVEASAAIAGQVAGIAGEPSTAVCGRACNISSCVRVCFHAT